MNSEERLRDNMNLDISYKIYNVILWHTDNWYDSNCDEKKYHRDDNIVKNQTFMQGWVIITTYALSIVEVGSIQFCNNNFAIMGSVEVVLVWYSHLRRYFIQVLTWVRKLIFLLIMIIKVGRNYNKTFICVILIHVNFYIMIYQFRSKSIYLKLCLQMLGFMELQ